MIRRAGKQAVLGVRRGARLGPDQDPQRLCDAHPSIGRRSGSTRVCAARAKRGVPIGAGRVGLVRTKLPRRGGPGDRDLDGIPNGIDVDDDGDLILDGYDRPATASSSARPVAGCALVLVPGRH